MSVSQRWFAGVESRNKPYSRAESEPTTAYIPKAGAKFLHRAVNPVMQNLISILQNFFNPREICA